MKRHLSILVAILSIANISFAQVKKATAVSKQSVFEAKIKATNLPYEKINDSTVVITFKGAVLASYQIIVTKTANMYVMLSNISNSIPNVENEKNFKRLLELNSELDFVKFSIEKDSGKIFASVDVLDSTIAKGTLSNLIGQIADAVDYAAQVFK